MKRLAALCCALAVTLPAGHVLALPGTVDGLREPVPATWQDVEDAFYLDGPPMDPSQARYLCRLTDAGEKAVTLAVPPSLEDARYYQVYTVPAALSPDGDASLPPARVADSIRSAGAEHVGAVIPWEGKTLKGEFQYKPGVDLSAGGGPVRQGGLYFYGTDDPAYHGGLTIDGALAGALEDFGMSPENTRAVMITGYSFYGVLFYDDEKECYLSRDDQGDLNGMYFVSGMAVEPGALVSGAEFIKGVQEPLAGPQAYEITGKIPVCT